MHAMVASYKQPGTLTQTTYFKSNSMFVGATTLALGQEQTAHCCLWRSMLQHITATHVDGAGMAHGAHAHGAHAPFEPQQPLGA